MGLKPEPKYVCKRVLLGVHSACSDGRDELADICHAWHETEGCQDLLIKLVVERPDGEALAICWCPKRPDAAGNVSEPVVPEAQHPPASPNRYLTGKTVPDGSVEQCKGPLSVAGGKGEIEQRQVRNARREIPGSHVAQETWLALEIGEEARGRSTLGRDVSDKVGGKAALSELAE
jgi:hypothetical protein